MFTKHTIGPKAKYFTLSFFGLFLVLASGALIYTRLSASAQNQLTIGILDKSLTLITQPAVKKIVAQTNFDSPTANVRAYFISSVGSSTALVPEKIGSTYTVSLNSSAYQPGLYTLKFSANSLENTSAALSTTVSDEYQLTIKSHQLLCTATICASWGSCQTDGYRYCQSIDRTPANCQGGTPDPVRELCDHVVCTFTYNNWSACQPSNSMSGYGFQSRTVSSRLPVGCVGEPSLTELNRQCLVNAPAKCQEIQYDSCEPCQNGQQLCKATLKTPTGCAGADYETKPCVATTSAECKVEWSCDDNWGDCQSSGWQYQNCKQTTCLNIVSPNPAKKRTCVYVPQNTIKAIVDCVEDKWTDAQIWTECLNGRKQKVFKKFFDCPNVDTPMPVLIENCSVVNQKTTDQAKNEKNNQPAVNSATNNSANQTGTTKIESQIKTTKPETPSVTNQATPMVVKEEPQVQVILNKTQIQEALPAECRSAGVVDSAACELYLRRQHSTNFCLQEGAQNKVDCRKLVEDKYQKPSQCANLSEVECNRLVNQVILADYIEPNKLTAAKKQIGNLTNQVIVINPDSVSQNKLTVQSVPLIMADKAAINKPIEQSEIVNSILPISSKQKTSLIVLNSVVEITSQQKRVSAVVLIDQDADGLPDDQEKRFGTDPKNIDTDGDGYSDLVEIRAGYNPLGPGKLITEISLIDKAIINQVAIEQPKEVSPTIDKDLKIVEVDNTNSTAGSYRITGQAKPNQIITLYIYSQMPLVLTTRADSNGNWVYQLDNSLNDGKHEVYVAINDDAGRIISQTTPLSFFVKEAKAVTMDQYIAEEQIPINTADPIGKMLVFYIVGGSALILVVFFLFVIFRKFFY